jgi:hypothetical protein
MTQPPPHPEGPGEFARDPDETEWRELISTPAAPADPQPDPTTDTADGLPRPAPVPQSRDDKRDA